MRIDKKRMRIAGGVCAACGATLFQFIVYNGDRSLDYMVVSGAALLAAGGLLIKFASAGRRPERPRQAGRAWRAPAE